MQVADQKRKKKRRRTNRGKVIGNNQSKAVEERRKDNDPLQSFQGELDEVGIEGDLGEEDFEDPMVDDMKPVETERAPTNRSITVTDKAVLSTTDGTGRSTSGRNAWKEKRRKGKFSKRSKVKNNKK